jgi:hypothetical protein
VDSVGVLTKLRYFRENSLRNTVGRSDHLESLLFFRASLMKFVVLWLLRLTHAEGLLGVTCSAQSMYRYGRGSC